MRPDPSFLANIVLVGESQVGKTQLFEQFARQRFTEVYLPTIGVDFVTFTQNIVDVLTEPSCIRLDVWDTAGEARFRNIVEPYYRGAHGVILTYSTTDRASFNAIPEWMERVKQTSLGTKLILVGTKADLGSAREVSYCEGVQLAERLGVPFLETSAKAGMHVAEAFFTLLMLIEQGRFSLKCGFTRLAREANKQSSLD